jgi:hypothetical protein
MTSGAGCKVDRVIAEYDLQGADPRHESLNEGLLARWRGENGHGRSGYRTLTEWFNRRLLRVVYLDHGRETVRVETDHEALSGDGTLRREEVVESLRSDGIDAEGVREAMVSWGTMRTHLTDCLDGRKASRSGDDWERDTVEMARSFAREKVESALSSLATKGRLDGVGRSSVSIQVHLECEECPTRVPLEVALERGYVCDRHGSGA